MTHEEPSSHPDPVLLSRQDFLDRLEATPLVRPWLSEAERQKLAVAETDRDQWLLQIKAHAPIDPERGWSVPTRMRWASAAGITGLAMVAVWWVGWTARPNTSNRVLEYATAVGERRTVSLPDGSSVILAPQSRIVLDKQFGAQGRTIALQGEALFTVTQDPARPFVVRTGAVATTVLGTEFVARRYRDERNVHVAVVTGKVAVRNHRTSITLTAGMTGEVDDSSSTTGISRSEVDRRRAWTEGELAFVSTPVQEVLASLGRWYGYEFQMTDSATVTQRVTATFKVSSPAQTLLELKRLLSVTMNVSGRTIVLRPDSTPDTSSPRAAPARRDPLDQSSTLPSGVGR